MFMREMFFVCANEKEKKLVIKESQGNCCKCFVKMKGKR